MSSPCRLSCAPACTFHLDGGAMFGVVPRTVWIKEYPSDAQNRIPLTTRTLFIASGDLRIVVDPGIGTALDATFLERYTLLLGHDPARAGGVIDFSGRYPSLAQPLPGAWPGPQTPPPYA